MGDSLPQSSAGKDYGRHRRGALLLRQRGCMGDHPRHTECGNDPEKRPGVAAALSLLHGVLPHDLNLQTLQKELRKNCGFPLHREDCGIPYENRIENTTGGKSS